MSKERELIKRVADRTAVTRRSVAEVFAALMGEGWLRDPAEPMPVLTITESEISKAFGTEYVAWARLCLARIGVTVVPDPEPTNAELLARDLDELNGGGFLIDNRHKEMIAKHLTDLGWTKTPEANDDR